MAKVSNLICALLYPNSIDPRDRNYSADIGLQYIKGNSDAYFTAGCYDTRDRALLSKLLGADNFKQGMKLIEPLHLSNSEGVPMYAVANGFYFIKIARGVAKFHDKKEDDKEKYTKVLADHLRINEEQAAQIIGSDMDLEGFTALCEAQKPRWKAEADQAIVWINANKHLTQVLKQTIM